MRSEKNKTPPDLGEALVTRWPYEAVGENFFRRGLIRTQERTARGLGIGVGLFRV